MREPKLEVPKGLLIGLDVGTQSVRCCVFDLNGNKVAEAVENLKSTSFLSPGFVEQNPEEWLQRMSSTLKTICQLSEVERDQIMAISYACTSCTVIATDQEGKPLRNALLWMDERAVEEAQQVAAADKLLTQYTGGDVSPQWYLPKAMWLSRHEPEVYREASRIVEQIDFVTYHLTGQWTLGYNHLVAKWNYNKDIGGWREGLFEELGIADIRSKWPEKILAVGSIVGKISPQLAKATNLPEDVLVVQGGMDATAGMLGLGSFKPGEVGMCHGTSTVIQCQSKTLLKNGITCRPDALAQGYYLVGGGETSTGSVVQWFLTRLSEVNTDNYSSVLERLDEQVREIPPGSNGIVALEYFQGSRVFKDPMARGAIWGLTLWHSAAHILRAFYEAIGFGIRLFFEKLSKNDYPVDQFTIGGGLALSDAANQILADICEIPVRLVTEKEQTALGAAIWAGVGIGVFEDFESGIAKMVRICKTYQPNPQAKEAYVFYYDKYLRTFENLKDLMHETVAFELGKKGRNTP